MIAAKEITIFDNTLRWQMDEISLNSKQLVDKMERRSFL